MRIASICLVTGALILSACGSQGQEAAPAASDNAGAAAGATQAASAPFPAKLNAFGDGYPSAGAPCRRLGESAVTSDWLDASATLVGCPTAGDAAALGGKVVGSFEGFTIVSMPSGDENAGMGEAAPAAPVAKAVAAAGGDIIRRKGGLEDKCKAAVAKQGATVIGTNRIEESQAAIEIFVNVEGGTAPWRCLGNRDGTISAVEFTGDEGAL